MGGVPTPDIATHFALAILTTVLCCLPVGAIALAQASKVKSKLAQGDYAGAQEASRKAKLYSIVGIVTGAIIIIVYARKAIEEAGGL
jgi:Na+-driven multidrug efflux pump